MTDLVLIDISEEIYHGEEYADFISGSAIWEVYSTCPAQYKYSVKNPTKAMEFGSQVHCAVLEPELFAKKYVAEQDWSDCLTSDAAMKSWLKAHGQSGYSTKKSDQLIEMILACDESVKIKKVEEEKWLNEIGDAEVIKKNDYEILTEMQQTIHQFGNYSSLISNGFCEKSIVGVINIPVIGGVKVKIRPDIISSDYLSITNYKTTTSAKPDDVVSSSVRLGYFAKEMFNYDVYCAWLRQNGASEDMINSVQVQILAQQKTPPYLPCGIVLTDEQKDIGRSQYMQGLLDLVNAKQNDTWATYTDGFIETETPAWAFYK